MKKSRTARPSVVVETPTVRSLPLVELLVDTKAERFELMGALGPPRGRGRAGRGSDDPLRAALCTSARARRHAAGTVPSAWGGRSPWRGRACAPRGARCRCHDLPDAGAGGPVESARRRADARGRGDAASIPQLGAGARGVVSRGTSKSRACRSLGAEVRARGIDWHHLPIVDVQPPDERFESSWMSSGPTLCRSLRGGAKVLVHCRGGLLNRRVQGSARRTAPARP